MKLSYEIREEKVQLIENSLIEIPSKREIIDMITSQNETLKQNLLLSQSQIKKQIFDKLEQKADNNIMKNLISEKADANLVHDCIRRTKEENSKLVTDLENHIFQCTDRIKVLTTEKLNSECAKDFVSMEQYKVTTSKVKNLENELLDKENGKAKINLAKNKIIHEFVLQDKVSKLTINPSGMNQNESIDKSNEALSPENSIAMNNSNMRNSDRKNIVLNNPIQGTKNIDLSDKQIKNKKKIDITTLNKLANMDILKQIPNLKSKILKNKNTIHTIEANLLNEIKNNQREMQKEVERIRNEIVILEVI